MSPPVHQSIYSVSPFYPTAHTHTNPTSGSDINHPSLREGYYYCYYPALEMLSESKCQTLMVEVGKIDQQNWHVSASTEYKHHTSVT